MNRVNFINRRLLVLSGILFLAALVCTRIPLLNYLGYEFSFFNALLAGLCCGVYTVGEWKRNVPASDGEYWRFVRGVLARSLFVMVLPLVVISVNALFVKNCSFTQGFRLYILYVVPSVVFSVGLGVVSSLTARKYKKTLFVTLFLLILAHIPYVTLTRPQIFAFNPIAGYFPGLTYDEAFGGEVRLIVYRIGTLAASALLFVGGIFLLTLTTHEKSGVGDRKRFVQYVAVSFAALVVCTGMYRLSDTIGLSSSATFIEEQLGGIRYTPHFKIVYPNDVVTPRRLRQLVLLHEYVFDELREEWHVNPHRPITVFLYKSPQQKERFIGAANTDFTKPWLRQVNINLDDVEAVLKHELVHAMLAPAGLPFFKVAPNSGLIEGAAVATERFEYGESIDDLAGQILALGIRPDVAGMFSLSGFFQSYPGVSYILAGSFCRFLIDRYGVERFKELYGSGNFRRWYGEDVTELVGAWQSNLERTRYSPQQLEKASYLFKRSPVFGKECVRVIAELNRKTRGLMEQKHYALALQSAEYSIRLSRNADAVFQKSVILTRLGRYAEASDFMEHQFADSMVRSTLLPLRLTLGDAYWGQEDYANAREQYSRLLADSLSLATDEAASIRLGIVSDPSIRDRFKPYFLEEMSDSARVRFLEKLKELPVADPFARYLLGREYSFRELDSRVVVELRPLPAMSNPFLEYLRNRRLARAAYNLGNYELAKMFSWRALNDVPNTVQFSSVKDFLRRCVWVQDHVR